MKKLKYLSLAVGILFVAISCDDNIPQSFKAEDTHVSFASSSASIAENSTSALKIPVNLAGVPGGVKVTVEFSTSNEGEAVPAVEGVDYKLSVKTMSFDNGFGTDTLYVEPIDNNEFTGNKTFYIQIASTTPQLIESVQNKIKVTITDDDHPFGALFGLYTITAVSGFDGTTTTAPAYISASDEDINTLYLDLGYDNVMEMHVTRDDGDIIVNIQDKQYIGPLPKPTDAYHPYFRAISVEGDNVYFQESMDGIFENDEIHMVQGYGIQAIHPVTGASAGFYELSLDGTVVFKKAE